MDRRTFIGSVSAIAATRGASAQPARRIYRVGILGIRATDDLVGPTPKSPSTKALLQGLRDVGYEYGEQYTTEARGAAGKPGRFPGLAAELVRLKVDVIVAAGAGLHALKQATSTIPVVMAAATDPLGSGYIQSLAHPGGNFTGFSAQWLETTGKRLELLKELFPGPALVAVVWERAALRDFQAAEAAARARGWRLLSLEIREIGELENAFKAATNAQAGTALVMGVFLFAHIRQVVDMAARSRLPAIYGLAEYVEAGGLMSYGADIDDLWRRAAHFVDKILKGAKPGDLPVEQPTKFELVVNLKAAKTLGLTIPQSILLRADEIIQ